MMVKTTLLDADPFGVITVIGPVPEDPTGTAKFNDVGPETIAKIEVIPPIEIVVWPNTKFVPYTLVH
jgi:hypothetical protein